MDRNLKWELIKLDIRNFTVPYSIAKKQKNSALESELNKRYNKLHAITHTSLCDPLIMEEFNNVKNELEQIEKHKANGIILRSKCKWVEQGEKNTSYFLRLEKHNFCNKLITQLDVDGKIISDPMEILRAEKLFYENLYTDPKVDNSTFSENAEIFTRNDAIPKVTDDQKELCELELTEVELLKSLKTQTNGSSPGSDGLPAEFYKLFWKDIKVPFVESVRCSMEKGELSIEQKRGIITLIPKKEKNRLFKKNWRPIALLNADYKIIAKALANRLCDMLPDIINEDQTGYIKGRYIGCNIRLVEDIIMYTENTNKPGIILTVDFEKAFDSISHKFIDKSLEAFNFGPKFRSLIFMLYNNISTSIINNGDISEWFSPTRGVRQGCPLSPYLFLIAVELLAIAIRENPNIKGIDVCGTDIKISQLADDTTCFVSDTDSIAEICRIFKAYEQCAGLKVNIEKTRAKFIGSLKNRTDSPFGLDWSEENVYTLGIKITGKEQDHYNLNFKHRILNLKNILKVWKGRKLSLKGKITVINNLALPPLLYVGSIIHVPNIVFKEVKKHITDLI